MYALAALFATAALWGAAEAIAREPEATRRARWALAGAIAVAAGLAAGTHYLALFALAGLAVGLALGWPATRGVVARLALVAVPVALAGAAAVLATGYAKQLRAAAGFFAARGGVNQTIFDDVGSRLARFPVDLVVEVLPGLNLKWLVIADYRWAAVVLFDLVAIAAFVLLAWRGGARWARSLALATALVPLPVIAAMLGTGQLRFFVVATPFVALAVGAGLDALRRPAWAAPAAAAAVVLVSALAVSWYYDPGMDKQPWRRVGTLVSSQARPGDVVLVNEPHLMIAFERYFARPEGVALEGYPEVGGVRIREGDLERWFFPLVRDRERVWFVRMAATASQSDPEGLALRWLSRNRRLVTRLREPGYNGDVELYLFER